MVEGEHSDYEEQRIRQIGHLGLRNELGLIMVSIRESTNISKDDLSIFPPINHENLYVDGFKSSSDSSSPSSSSSSSLSPSSDSDEQFEFDRKLHSQPSERVGKSRWKFLFARLLSNFEKLVTFFPRISLCCSISKTLRSFYPVVVIVIWWWMRNRRRLRQRKIAANLRDTIKERDERIAQLLHQIDQMKELLVKFTHLN